MAVFDLEAVIKLTDQGFKQGLNAAGKAVSTFGKVAGKALLAGGAAVSALTVSSVKAYAEYQQLAGGVQKLFGDSAGQMMQYAQDAYKTAGMSANQFMEQSTSFAAALIQSYSGDTAKAADQANKAMMAISDNFNTFGGDIQSVQSAFQGFAKQNYTMLDNLKLGYGGTKTEMERLIADANEYAESLGKASDLSIENFGDIVEAIDLIQQKQGIAGTTAKEAATTISGSLGMVKAAWQNLLVAFADKDADLSKYFNDLTSSAETAFNNILPVAEQALTGIGQFVADVAPTVGKKLPGLIKSTLPNIVKAGTSLITGLLTGFTQALPDIVASIPEIINGIKDGFVDSWPALKEAGRQLMSMAAEGLSAGGEFLMEAVHNLFTGVLGISEESWQSLKEGASETLSGLASSLSGLWDSVVDFAKSAFEGLKSFWQTWGGTIGTIFSSAWDVVKTVFKASLNNIKALLGVFSAAFKGDWRGTWEAVKNLASTAWNGITSVLSTAWNGIKAVAASVWDVVKEHLSAVWDSIKAKASAVWSAITSAISSAWGVIKGVAATVWASITSTISNAWSNIKSGVTNGINAVRSAVSSGFSAIVGVASSVWNSVKSTISNAINGAKAAVQNGINAIKSAFNVSLSFPKIKLPHFAVTGRFSLDPPSFPRFSVTWNAKAMNDPYLFSNATLFGAGETGDEMLYGKANLMNDIRDVNAESNAALAAKIDEILVVLAEYLPQAVSKPVMLDGKALVGAIGADMDGELGDISLWRGRGLSMA